MIERRVYIIFSQIFVKNRLEFSLLSRSLAWIYASINQDSILSSYTLVLYLDLITSYTEYHLLLFSHSRCSIGV